MESLNSINIEKYTNDKNKIIKDENDFIYTDEQMNHNSKRIDYSTIKEEFKNKLEKEDNI
jgi:hypothetical protein